ncbi:MAG: hypothetical protein J5858_16535 [Lentisphaeria bacterium]|nr:hypothetical protein [Lentisphaeria bacterium]
MMIELEQLRRTYREINESFSKTLVFHCGAAAGIFSEINGMLFFMAYCLKHRIRFTMYSDDANFSRGGWQSYFLPFCSESHEPFHHHYNHRQTYISGKNEVLKLLQFFPKIYLKRKYHFDYLTYELWGKVIAAEQKNEPLHYPELGMTGTFRDALPILQRIVWNYNDRTRTEIDRLLEKVAEHEDYAGIQLRFGDKGTEAVLVESQRYFALLKARTDLRRIFIMTDDYDAGYRSLTTNYPDLSFFTLTPATDHGYSQSVRDHQTESEKRTALTMLFASVEMMIKCRIFCGMLSSNPSRFIWIARNYYDCIFVDRPE